MNKTAFIIASRVVLPLLLAGPAGVMAQHVPATGDTVMKGATIEVIQSYKPQVKQAPKPEWVPQLPPADTSHPAFTYDVPQQTLYYTYTSLPLRPLALGAEIPKLPFANYVKVGAGNLSTLYLDAGIGGISGKDYETDFHLHHLSQKGSLKYQQSSLSGIEAEGVFHGDNNDWHAMLNAERNEYYYYGYDHTSSLSKTDAQLVYTTIRATVDMKNKADSINNINYHPSINASVYTGRVNVTETTLGFNAPFSYRIDNTLHAQLDLNGALTQYKVRSATTNNSFVEVLPGITLNAAFSGHALLGLAIGKESTFYLLPDVLAAYTIPDSKFAISGGYQAILRQNTFEQLSTENPYMNYVYSVMQTRRDEVFGNVQTGVGDHLSFSGRVSWWNYKNLPTFPGFATPNPANPFYVVYDNVNAISLQLGARYKQGNFLSLGATGDFYRFYNGSQLYAWHEPNVKIKGDLTFTPGSKLSVTAYLAFMAGITAKNAAGGVVKLNPVADLGGNAEYLIVPRVSAFVQLNNILNNKYQRWLGYQAYGLNIYGGLRLKF